jgi:hypothetical protein
MQMLRYYYVAPTKASTIGDGYRCFFDITPEGTRKPVAVLFSVADLMTVRVPKDKAFAKAKAIAYRPRVVRKSILTRARDFTRFGLSFDRRGTEKVLTALAAEPASAPRIGKAAERK